MSIMSIVVTELSCIIIKLKFNKFEVSSYIKFHIHIDIRYWNIIFAIY